MFRSQRGQRPTAFGLFVHLCAGLCMLSFVFAVIFASVNLMGPGAGTDVISETNSVTFKVLSVQTLLPEFAGSLGSWISR